MFKNVEMLKRDRCYWVMVCKIKQTFCWKCFTFSYVRMSFTNFPQAHIKWYLVSILVYLSNNPRITNTTQSTQYKANNAKSKCCKLTEGRIGHFFPVFSVDRFICRYTVHTCLEYKRIKHIGWNFKICIKGGSRHKVHHYKERVIFYVRHFSNWSTLHRNALAAWAACLDPRRTLHRANSIKLPCSFYDLNHTTRKPF